MPLFQQPFMSGGFPSMNRAAGAVGGWVEVGRTTLGGTSDNITVSSLSDKRYYMVLVDGQSSGATRPNIRLNGDTGSNYSYRYSSNGGGDLTATSQAQGEVSNHAPSSIPQFNLIYLANLSTNEKLGISHNIVQNTAGAGTAPNRTETVFKHAQTSNPINSVTVHNDQGGDWASGAECVVLGWDPADTHTNNFWEELTHDTLGSPATTFDSSTVTAKKYNWLQIVTEYSASSNMYLRVGNSTIDTGTNYAYRKSKNGAADGTTTSASTGVRIVDNTSNTRYFTNVFFINNASTEKLFIIEEVEQNTAGAGNSPYRMECVGKWDNTSNQVDICQVYSDSGNMAAGAEIIWWGAD